MGRNSSFRFVPGNPVVSRALLPAFALSLFVAASAAQAEKDTLGDFERAAGTEDSNIGVEVSDEKQAEEDEEFAFLGLLALPALGLFTIGRTNEVFANHQAGEPAAALLRLDATYQRLAGDDVDAFGFGGQVIWSFVGVGGEFLRYEEGSPKQKLRLGSFEAIFRLLPSENLRLQVSLGGRTLDGTRNYTGLQGGISAGLYPVEWAGLEIDLRWADIDGSTLEDYRAGLLLRHPEFPFVGVRGGYRIMRIGNSDLDGGEVGVAITF